jgi:hypothetical protein
MNLTKPEARTAFPIHVLLRALVQADGALLIWQAPGNTTDWEFAIDNGAVILDAEHDLYVHPAARALGDGAYTLVERPQ